MADSTLAEHVKLIVCSIDYSKGGLARIILNKALTATNEVRHTQFFSYLRFSINDSFDGKVKHRMSLYYFLSELLSQQSAELENEFPRPKETSIGD